MLSEGGRIPLWIVATVAGMGVICDCGAVLLRCLRWPWLLPLEIGVFGAYAIVARSVQG